MFGAHIWELVVVLGLALVVFGPKRLPEIGGALGKGIREFKKGTSELGDSLADDRDTSPETARRIPPAATDRDAG
jgi:TatA/E family protein of Tat protein translocase